MHMCIFRNTMCLICLQTRGHTAEYNIFISFRTIHHVLHFIILFMMLKKDNHMMKHMVHCQTMMKHMVHCQPYDETYGPLSTIW